MSVGMYGGKFLPFHMGHLSMIIKTSTMVDELFVVLSYSHSRDLYLTQNSGIREMPYSLRLRWLIEATKDLTNVKILAVEDTAVTDDTYDWAKGSADIQQAIVKPINKIFGSEEYYRSIFKEHYPNADYLCLDPDRSSYPISATKIRKVGVFNHWDFLPSVVRPYFIKRIAIVGTESCGKSTMTKKLAAYFNTTFVEEYGRTYSEKIGGSDGILFNEDFMMIAFGHKMAEYNATRTSNKLLFIDTEAIVTQYYSNLYGEGYLSALDGIIHSQQYDLILYLEPDIPWVQDGTRHHGEKSIREANNQTLKNLFSQYNVPYISIDGSFEERFAKCIESVQSIIS